MENNLEIYNKRAELVTQMEDLRNEIATSESIPQLQDLRNKGDAWKALYKDSGWGLDVQNLGAEVKIRAERRMGEMLGGMERATIKDNQYSDSNMMKLSDLGISKTQSHRYQQLARIPDKEFEDGFTLLKRFSREYITAFFVNIAKAIERENRIEDLKKRAEDYKEADDMKIWHGDFRELSKEIPDNSIDLILTDPPYPKEYLYLWQDLFKVAARVLKPSGFLVAYSGQMYLDEIFKMDNELIYYWMMSIEFTKKPLIMGRKILNEWKPILIYQKQPFELKEKAIADKIKFEYTERELHDKNWGQTLKPFEFLVESFSEVGDTVLEPFAGTGTTLIACKNKKRKVIGIELEEEYIKLIKGRLTMEDEYKK